jgi:hypothetical protein
MPGEYNKLREYYHEVTHERGSVSDFVAQVRTKKAEFAHLPTKKERDKETRVVRGALNSAVKRYKKAAKQYHDELSRIDKDSTLHAPNDLIHKFKYHHIREQKTSSGVDVGHKEFTDGELNKIHEEMSKETAVRPLQDVAATSEHFDGGAGAGAAEVVVVDPQSVNSVDSGACDAVKRFAIRIDQHSRYQCGTTNPNRKFTHTNQPHPCRLASEHRRTTCFARGWWYHSTAKDINKTRGCVERAH